MEGGESIRVSETDCVTSSFGFLGFLVVLMGFLVVLVVYFWIDFLCKFWLLSRRQTDCVTSCNCAVFVF